MVWVGRIVQKGILEHLGRKTPQQPSFNSNPCVQHGISHSVMGGMGACERSPPKLGPVVRSRRQ